MTFTEAATPPVPKISQKAKDMKEVERVPSTPRSSGENGEKEKETEGMKNIRQNSVPAQADHVDGIRGSPKDPGSTADTQAVQTQGANLDTTEKI